MGAITNWFRGTLFRMKPGDSWTQPDGSTLTYLGKAEDPWAVRQCAVCGGPATQYKMLPPWPGTTYSHTSMTCDEHASYLDGKTWGCLGEGPWEETSSTSSCAYCSADYGSCVHTEKYAAMAAGQENLAVRGRLSDN